MLEEGGHRAYFVGGCVRNALIGAEVSDVDIATDARPERVAALAFRAGLKAIPTGIAHGTVTVVSGGHAFEVTTFRRDVATDGRRAVVVFSDDVAEDAARRDFTMNALYAAADGTVIDPTGEGLADLAARRVRFVGEPARRIAEDHLRVLRFFRFHAWYGDPGSTYRYSGHRYVPLPWPALLMEVRRRIEQATGHAFNAVLGNRYRDGGDAMGWHSDDEAELGARPVIASATFGATRRFLLRHRRSGRREALELSHGSLLLMAGDSQRCWQHSLPRTKRAVGLRINLTFRCIGH